MLYLDTDTYAVNDISSLYFNTMMVSITSIVILYILITPIYAYYNYFDKARMKCITSIVISYMLITPIYAYFYYFDKARMKCITSIVISYMLITPINVYYE